jgi:hypothetical protein
MWLVSADPSPLPPAPGLPKITRLKSASFVECRGGGMADAEDSKSSVGNHVRVQVPPSASMKSSSFWSLPSSAYRESTLTWAEV